MRTIDVNYPVRAGVLAPLIACAFLAAAPAAFAQSESGAIAEGLFREGRTLLEQGKIDKACEKFEASDRMSPAPGTRLNLALCREKQGRTATAWSLFAEVEAIFARAGDDRRASIAHTHGVALFGQLKKVIIEVPTPPPGMVIKLDGVSLPVGALGTEIPLDPGTHDVTASAPGKKTWEQANLNLGPSATTIHVRVDFENEGGAAPSAAPVPSPFPPTAASQQGSSIEPAAGSAPAPESPGDGSTKRYIGIGVGGVGLVALGFATYYGVTALSRKNDEANYPVGSVDRLTVYNQASGAQTAELVVGAVGLVCVGTGLYLVLSSLHSGAPATTSAWTFTPAAGPRGGGFSLTRAF